jgi:hypothetical protein
VILLLVKEELRPSTVVTHLTYHCPRRGMQVTDTGVNVDSVFFTDPNNVYIDANNQTKAFCKVLDYFTFFDGADRHGRGTHVAGE